MKRSLDDLYTVCLKSLGQVCQTPINPLQGFTFGKSWSCERQRRTASPRDVRHHGNVRELT